MLDRNPLKLGDDRLRQDKLDLDYCKLRHHRDLIVLQIEDFRARLEHPAASVAENRLSYI
jgi:hypothetical protein